MNAELITTDAIDDAITVEQRAEGAGQRLVIRLASWGEQGLTPQGVETFARGAFAGIDASAVVLESQRHGGELVGIGESIEERDDGPYGVFRISDTTAGRDLLTLVRDRVLRSASVVFTPVTSRRRPDGVIQRDRVDLRRVAVLERGAYRSAQVIAVREEHVMPPEGIEQPTVEAFDPAPILTRLDSVDEAIARVLASATAGGAAPAHELARFDTMGEAYMASTEDPTAREALVRVLADQITSDNPGLVQPGWLREVKNIVSVGRPGIAAFGGAAALPDSGMELDWPLLTPLAGPIIGVQATEKSEVTTGKVSFTKGSKAIATYAGASDVSYQLLRRSSPAYRDAYARVMLSEYAKVTDNVFVDTLAALTAAVIGWNYTTDTDGQAFVAMLFGASVKVQKETGSPADVVLAATDVFLGLSTKTRIMPPVPFPSNAVGSAQANTLRMNASGLDIIHDPNLPAGKFIVSNSLAARWHEDGPFPVEAEDVAKLGKNIAYWGLGATAVYIPAGVVVGTTTGTLPTPLAVEPQTTKQAKD